MNDTLRFMQKDPVHRRYHHHDLTFGLLYAFTENFILPLSHDEVVHGKGSLLGKMPGDLWQRFANLRAYYGFMWGHPGKKLLFMGGEIGQEREWNHDTSLDWHLLDDPLHAASRTSSATSTRSTATMPALHQLDFEAGRLRVARSRRLGEQRPRLRCAGAAPEPRSRSSSRNFTPVPRAGYRIGVPRRRLLPRGPQHRRRGLRRLERRQHAAASTAEASESHGRPHLDHR